MWVASVARLREKASGEVGVSICERWLPCIGDVLLRPWLTLGAAFDGIAASVVRVRMDLDADASALRRQATAALRVAGRDMAWYREAVRMSGRACVQREQYENVYRRQKGGDGCLISRCVSGYIESRRG